MNYYIAYNGNRETSDGLIRRHQSTAVHIFNRRLNGTIDLNDSDRNIETNYQIAQNAGNNLMVDYDCINAIGR